MCVAIVQLYRMYSLYYPVLRVSSDLCAVYLYYFAAPTQILRALAAPTQLVPATASHRLPPLKHRRTLPVLRYPRNTVIYNYLPIGVIFMVILHIFLSQITLICFQIITLNTQFG